MTLRAKSGEKSKLWENKIEKNIRYLEETGRFPRSIKGPIIDSIKKRFREALLIRMENLKGKDLINCYIVTTGNIDITKPYKDYKNVGHAVMIQFDCKNKEAHQFDPNGEFTKYVSDEETRFIGSIICNTDPDEIDEEQILQHCDLNARGTGCIKPEGYCALMSLYIIYRCADGTSIKSVANEIYFGLESKKFKDAHLATALSVFVGELIRLYTLNKNRLTNEMRGLKRMYDVNNTGVMLINQSIANLHENAISKKRRPLIDEGFYLRNDDEMLMRRVPDDRDTLLSRTGTSGINSRLLGSPASGSGRWTAALAPESSDALDTSRVLHKL